MGGISDSFKGWVFIPNCRSIHTFTLRHPIDIEWVDAEGKLLRRELSVPPRSIRRCLNAYGVRERYSPRALMKQGGWGATEAIVAIPIALMFSPARPTMIPFWLSRSTKMVASMAVS